MIGAVSTFATSWMTQTAQARTARLNAERSRRDELYGKFMEEAANLFSHAATEEQVDFSRIVSIYALRGKILLQSSEEVTQQADEIIDRLLTIYLSPNRSPEELLAESRRRDFMKPFARACRAELSGLR